MENLEQNLDAVTKLVDLAIEFGVKYGFQILGALAFFVLGFIVANWIGNRLEKFSVSKNIDPTLSQFIGSTSKLILTALLVIITLGNFGVSIAPLIALAGAISLGATLALQGPMSNFGAGIAIILTRPFVVGNVITVLGVHGIVEKVTLGMTFLTGEDGEQIAIPNKEIVGQVIVNSRETRILELEFSIAQDADVDGLLPDIETILKNHPDISDDPSPQVGLHDFTFGGLVIGFRAWIPGRRYFQVRYQVNKQILELLKSRNISLFTPEGMAMPVRARGLSSAQTAGIVPPPRNNP